VPTATLELTPEQEASLLIPQELGIQLDPEHPQADLCAYLNEALDLPLLALAINDCGKRKVGDQHACGNVNNFHTVHCRKAAHLSCALFEANKSADALVAATDKMAVAHPNWHLIYAEIHVPHAAASESTKELKERSKKSFLSLFPGALEAYQSKHSTAQRFECTNPGMTDTGELVFRFLTYGEIHPSLQQIRDVFSWAFKVIPSIGTMEERVKFIGFIMKPTIPKSPALQAAMCVSLEGVRKVETFGEVAEKLQKETSTGATSPHDKTPKKPSVCPYCQAEFVGRVVLPEREYPRCQFRFNSQMIC
jgi:hypothetical protein